VGRRSLLKFLEDCCGTSPSLCYIPTLSTGLEMLLTRA
jgi:hypothetical protein